MWVNGQGQRGPGRPEDPDPGGEELRGSENPDAREEGPEGTREPRPWGRGTVGRPESADPRGEGPGVLRGRPGLPLLP